MANPVALPGTVVSSGAAVSPGGAQGVTGTPAWTTNTSGFTIPNVGSTVSVTVADASWIVVGEMLYVDQAGGGVGLSGILQVTAKTGNTLTLLNPQPAPAIPPADNTQPGLLKQLSGNVTDYVGGDNACHSIAAISAFVSKTAAYTLTTADSGKYVICSNGSWTLTLPAPVVGLNYRLRNDMGISGTIGTITLQPNGGTIDGQASIPLLPQQECTVVTDGVNWRTHGLKREVILGTQDTTTTTASAFILLPVGYRYFELQFDQIAVDTDGNSLVFQLSADGGTTWITAAASYWEAIVYDSAATTTAYLAGSSATGTISTVQSTLALSIGGGRSRFRFCPGSASTVATWSSESGGWRNSDAREHSYYIQGFFNGPAGIKNALKYFPASAGNITRCFLTVKGVV